MKNDKLVEVEVHFANELSAIVNNLDANLEKLSVQLRTLLAEAPPEQQGRYQEAIDLVMGIRLNQGGELHRIISVRGAIRDPEKEAALMLLQTSRARLDNVHFEDMIQQLDDDGRQIGDQAMRFFERILTATADSKRKVRYPLHKTADQTLARILLGTWDAHGLSGVLAGEHNRDYGGNDFSAVQERAAGAVLASLVDMPVAPWLDPLRDATERLDGNLRVHDGHRALALDLLLSAAVLSSESQWISTVLRARHKIPPVSAECAWTTPLLAEAELGPVDQVVLHRIAHRAWQQHVDLAAQRGGDQAVQECVVGHRVRADPDVPDVSEIRTNPGHALTPVGFSRLWGSHDGGLRSPPPASIPDRLDQR